MQTLDEWFRSLVMHSARGQSAVQNGSEIVFPLCWQIKAAVIFILAGCGFLLFAVITGGHVLRDRWYIVLIPLLILVPLPVAIVLLLPGRVVVDPASIRQRRWWIRENGILWHDVASVIHDPNDGSTIVYGKFGSPITFSPYLADQARFDSEVKAFSQIDEIPDGI